ncbi:MAG: hypothetical protein FD122_56 [Stygiobacter sp.]|nr:MAG: hypothetical protein FD122_56 [Stygiobacter sp.]KAF0217185.1 MAG: hypothetical protein FD178_721 [Ignavibacteria bacterium]
MPRTNNHSFVETTKIVLGGIFTDKGKEIFIKSFNQNRTQITISGQRTYQSDVTSLPIAQPGMKIESLTQDQYKAIADISQVI